MSSESSPRDNALNMVSLKELILEKISAVRELMDERDHRYEDRFVAMDEKTSLALAGSEKAVSKAEAATEKRFDAVNEFRSALGDQASLQMPRKEADAKFVAFEDKINTMKDSFSKEIAGLKESRSESVGAKEQGQESKLQNHWVIGLIISLGLALVGWGVTVTLFMSRKP